jgi:arylsulfatase A-like enzyme
MLAGVWGVLAGSSVIAGGDMSELDRRTFLRASGLAAAGLLWPYRAMAQPTGKKPNVLFIAVDDLNDWVGYLGGHPQAHTPHLDALAKQSIVFSHAYCAAPVCGPSRTALMYGIAPHKSGSYGHHKMYAPNNLIPERQPLTQAFKNSGYYTAGCGKIFHYREQRGWDEYKSGFGGMGVKREDREPLGENISLSWGMIDTDNDSDTGDGKLTDWAIERLKRDHDKPFFIALGLRKPHLPWDAPRKYFNRLDPDSIQLPNVPADDLDDVPEAGKEFARSLVGFVRSDDHKAITAADGAWEKLVRAYLATSSFADANVGRILTALDNSPYRDNTIVVLWGDHGWHLGEKHHWRKMSLWERGTRTPFIIRLPGSNPVSGRVEAPVSLQDIYPTLVDLCGLDVSQPLDGNSLQPVLADPTAAWDKPVLISHGPGNFAVRQGRWRLIHYADGSEELYDLVADPGELTNLAEQREFDKQRETLRAHVPRDWRYVMGPRFQRFNESFARPPGGIADE